MAAGQQYYNLGTGPSGVCRNSTLAYRSQQPPCRSNRGRQVGVPLASPAYTYLRNSTTVTDPAGKWKTSAATPFT